jgi:hypothetical protein
MGEMRSAYRILVGKSGSLGENRRRWEDNINTDLNVTECEGVNWIYLAQDRNQWQALVNTIIRLRLQ